MPKGTTLPIVGAGASFFVGSTFHLVLEALEPGPIALTECPHRPRCLAAGCAVRQAALRKVALQVLLGVSLLHDQMGYVHADLKPENILRFRDGDPSSASRMKVKLIDLGNAVPIDRLSLYNNDFEIQSVQYRAPEVLLFPCCLLIRYYWDSHLMRQSISSQ
jgi:serine/threonine protein kinase